MEPKIYRFEQLSVNLLYDVLRLREQVFMLEQHSLYEDIDNKDKDALHLCVFEKGQLIGYLRLRLLHDLSKAKIERVVVAAAYRSKKLAKVLMKKALEIIDSEQDIDEALLSAQVDVMGFYEKLGFAARGAEYDDGGIAHKDMVKYTNQKAAV